MTETTMIPPKMAGVVLFPVVLMGVSGDVVGVVGQVAGVVGQASGCCVTTTPVKENKLGHCYLLGHIVITMCVFQPGGAGSVFFPSNSCSLMLNVTASENK